MKAITIHQPWASLIAHGFKRYETRGWRTHYRGPIAIHAGKWVDKAAVGMIQIRYPEIWKVINPLPTGCIVAVAELSGCFISTEDFLHGGFRKIWIDPQERDFGNFARNRCAWELTNVRRLPEPIPVRGQQGLWNWEPHDDWKCVVCKEFVVGGGLCEDCIEQETETAVDLGLI